MENYWTNIAKFAVLALFLHFTLVKAEEKHCQKARNRTYIEYICQFYQSIPLKLDESENVKLLNMSTKSNSLEILFKDILVQAKLPNLENLQLQNCSIRTVENSAFRGGANLVVLNLSYNQLQKLDLSVFADLPNLETLWLDHNPLIEFPKGTTFPKLDKLQRLDLESCGLTSIHPKLFKNLGALEKLQLFDNQLITLDWRVFLPLGNLKVVYLHKNPWKCDCHIRFLLEILIEMKIEYTKNGKSSVPKCSPIYDEIFLGKKTTSANWTSVNLDLLTCPPQILSFSFTPYEKNNSSNTFLIQFQCQFSGFPAPQITWKKNGSILSYDESKMEVLRSYSYQGQYQEAEKFKVKFREELLIDQVHFKDEGIYECLVSSSAGNASDSVSFKLDSINPSDNLFLIVLLAIVLLLLLLICLVTIQLAPGLISNLKNKKWGNVKQDSYKPPLPIVPIVLSENTRRNTESNSLPAVTNCNAQTSHNYYNYGDHEYEVPNAFPPPIPARPPSTKPNSNENSAAIVAQNKVYFIKK